MSTIQDTRLFLSVGCSHVFPYSTCTHTRARLLSLSLFMCICTLTNTTLHMCMYPTVYSFIRSFVRSILLLPNHSTASSRKTRNGGNNEFRCHSKSHATIALYRLYRTSHCRLPHEIKCRATAIAHSLLFSCTNDGTPPGRCYPIRHS